MHKPKHTDWKTERAEKLHRLCARIAAYVQQGMTIKAAVRKGCGGKRYRAKYRSIPGKRLSLSQRSVSNLYRAWRQHPQPCTVMPRYKPGIHSVITPGLVREIARRAVVAESLKGVYISLQLDWIAGFSLPGIPRTLAARYKQLPFSYTTMISSLPLAWRRELRKHRAARRKLLNSLSKPLERKR